MNSLKLIKRLIDLSVAIVLAFFLAPLGLAIAVCIFFTMGNPVLFKQQRSGLNGKPFAILKFRTMRDLRSGERIGVDDTSRITRFGKFLRGSSLDELPQLINVILGDISLVGPRPLLTQYVDRYNRHQARRLDVVPGITGWAQINGRNAITWEKRFDLDVWYVDNWSIWLDLKILFLTVVKVARGSDIQTSAENTMTEFMGSPETLYSKRTKGKDLT